MKFNLTTAITTTITNMLITTTTFIICFHSFHTFDILCVVMWLHVGIYTYKYTFKSKHVAVTVNSDRCMYQVMCMIL